MEKNGHRKFVDLPINDDFFSIVDVVFLMSTFHTVDFLATLVYQNTSLCDAALFSDIFLTDLCLKITSCIL